MKKPEFINGTILRENDLKPEFIPKKKGLFYFLEINPDSKYGAVAIISIKFGIFDDLTKRKSKNISEALNNLKPVDTSKWVKPDKESLKRELVLNLFLETIYKEDEEEWIRVNASASTLYNILHSHWITNPQLLTHFGRLQSPLENIMTEYKIRHKYDIQSYIERQTHKSKEEVRKDRGKYLKELTKKMIKFDYTDYESKRKEFLKSHKKWLNDAKKKKNNRADSNGDKTNPN